MQKGVQLEEKGGKDHELQVSGHRRKYSLPPSIRAHLLMLHSKNRKLLKTHDHKLELLCCHTLPNKPPVLPHNLSEVAFWIKVHGAACKTIREEGGGTPLAFLVVASD